METKRDCSIVFTRTLEVASSQSLADLGTWVGGQSLPCCLDFFPAAIVDAAVEGSAVHPESAIASFAWSQMFLGAVTVFLTRCLLHFYVFSVLRKSDFFSLLRRFFGLSQNPSSRVGQHLDFSEKPLRYEDRKNLEALKRN